MQRVGIADVGSNTARLIVFSYEPGEWYQITDGIREPVRLGEGLAETGRLTDNAIRRGVAAVELFSDYAAATGLDNLQILATSAIRDAENGQEFLERIAPLEHRVEVVSGEVEAELGVQAVANGFALDDAWVIDLGGGSAQISRMKSRRYAHGAAYPLGAVRLTEKFLRSDPPEASEVRKLEAYVEKRLRKLTDQWEAKWPLVAIGGTIRNLARIAQKAEQYPLAMLHGYRFSREALEETTETLLATRLKRRLKVPGVNPYRADVIVAGALVYRWLVRRLELEGLHVSGHGVREGAFYRHFLSAPYLIEDLRSFSVLNRARRHPLPAGHVHQVRRLAGDLFEALAPLHGLDEVDRQLLDAAAVLHDTGTTLDYYRHHKHGAYLLTIAPLNGFSHRELALLALMVRYHRKGWPRLGPYRSLMKPGDGRRMGQLAVCLRLAESLERSRAGRVRGVEVRLGKRKARIRLDVEEDPTIELWEAQKHADVFEEFFGRLLVLEAAASSPPKKHREKASVAMRETASSE